MVDCSVLKELNLTAADFLSYKRLEARMNAVDEDHRRTIDQLKQACNEKTRELEG